jgi:S1-C subfamily serine protease
MRSFSRPWITFPLLAAAAALLAACAYRGEIDESAYAASERAKLGASVALLDDGGYDKLVLSGSNPVFPFKLSVGAAMKQALTKELEASFTEVATVARLSAEDTSDFYALTGVNWIPVRPDGPGYAYRLGVRLVLVLRQGRAVVADYREETSVAFHPPAQAQAAALAESATLFALAPITEPMKNDAFGKEIEKAAHEGIEDVMHRLGKDMANDSRLELAAAMGPVQESAAPSGAPSPYDKFMNAVVVIKTAGKGMGSGFFVSKDGMIITCSHVVGDAAKVEVKDRGGHIFDGEVLDRSKERDLALIKVMGSDFATLPLAAGGMPTVGREVIAIGTPEGLSWSVSKGIVSALRSMRSAKVVQTDASFAHGSSGGPLIDLATGRVVGIASLTMASGPGSSVNFAIAAEEVQKAFGPKLSGL